MSGGSRLGDDSRTSARATVRTVAASPRRRFLAFAAFQTVGVAILAGIAFRLLGVFTMFTRINVGRSGPAAALTTLVLVVLVIAALGLYLAIPVAVAWYVATRSDRHWISGAVWAAIAVVSLPWLAGSLFLFVPGSTRDPLLGALALVGGAAVVVAADRLVVRHVPAEVPARPPPGIFLGLLLVVAVGGAVVGGSVLFSAYGPVTLLVECPRCGGFVVAAPPAADFEYDYTPTDDGRGVLTVTHAGGEALETEVVTLGGSGFADVAGADQTAPGPWHGEATGTTDDGEPAIARDDSVTVGVASDCEVLVVWEDEFTGAVQTVGEYDCRDSAGASDDASLEPPPLPGGR